MHKCEEFYNPSGKTNADLERSYPNFSSDCSCLPVLTPQQVDRFLAIVAQSNKEENEGGTFLLLYKFARDEGRNLVVHATWKLDRATKVSSKKWPEFSRTTLEGCDRVSLYTPCDFNVGDEVSREILCYRHGICHDIVKIVRKGWWGGDSRTVASQTATFYRVA